MTASLNSLIEAAKALSPLERLNLISAITQSLQRSYQQMLPAVDFWEPKALEYLSQAQRTQPVADIAELRAGYWPEDESADEESADDLITYIYDQRREDRLKH
jgi:hypothetical protein